MQRVQRWVVVIIIAMMTVSSVASATPVLADDGAADAPNLETSTGDGAALDSSGEAADTGDEATGEGETSSEVTSEPMADASTETSPGDASETDTGAGLEPPTSSGPGPAPDTDTETGTAAPEDSNLAGPESIDDAATDTGTETTTDATTETDTEPKGDESPPVDIKADDASLAGASSDSPASQALVEPPGMQASNIEVESVVSTVACDGLVILHGSPSPGDVVVYAYVDGAALNPGSPLELAWPSNTSEVFGQLTGLPADFAEISIEVFVASDTSTLISSATKPCEGTGTITIQSLTCDGQTKLYFQGANEDGTAELRIKDQNGTILDSTTLDISAGYPYTVTEYFNLSGLTYTRLTAEVIKEGVSTTRLSEPCDGTAVDALSVTVSNLAYSCATNTLSFDYSANREFEMWIIGTVPESIAKASVMDPEVVPASGQISVKWEYSNFSYSVYGRNLFGSDEALGIAGLATSCATISNMTYACTTDEVTLSFDYAADSEFALSVMVGYTDAARTTATKATPVWYETVPASGHFTTTVPWSDNSLVFEYSVYSSPPAADSPQFLVGQLDVDCATDAEPQSAQMNLMFTLCANEACEAPHDTSQDGSTVTWTIWPEVAATTFAIQQGPVATVSGILEGGIATGTSPALPFGTYSVCVDPVLEGSAGETRIATKALCNLVDLTNDDTSTPPVIATRAFVQAPDDSEEPGTPDDPVDPEEPAQPDDPDDPQEQPDTPTVPDAPDNEDEDGEEVDSPDAAPAPVTQPVTGSSSKAATSGATSILLPNTGTGSGSDTQGVTPAIAALFGLAALALAGSWLVLHPVRHRAARR